MYSILAKQQSLAGFKHNEILSSYSSANDEIAVALTRHWQSSGYCSVFQVQVAYPLILFLFLFISREFCFDKQDVDYTFCYSADIHTIYPKIREHAHSSRAVL